MRKNILFIDNGTSFRKKIINILLEEDVDFAVRPWSGDFPEANNMFLSFDGIIMSGSKMNVFEDIHPTALWKEYGGTPLLLICYAQQLYLYDNYHIPVVKCNRTVGERGRFKIKILEDSILFTDIDFKENPKVYHYHWYVPKSLPSHYKITSTTKYSSFASWENENNHVYGLQWHPEVLPHTKKVLSNFINLVC